MNVYSSITFFYPSRIVGGAEFLFLRLAKILSQKYLLDVYYIDFLDGFARKMSDSESRSIKFLEFGRFSKVQLPPNTIIITPLSSIIDVLRYFKADRKTLLLFWSIQPLGLRNSLNYYFGFPNSTADTDSYRKSLDKMSSLDAIYFMDGPNFYIQKHQFNYNISEPKFIPIPCQLSDSKTNNKEVDVTHINIGWLGRLSEEKIHSLTNILSHAKSLVIKENIDLTIHVIGEGDMSFNVENYPRIQVVFLGSLIGDHLTNYLSNNIDLLFAMGTSTLEGASLKIPTILVDFSYDLIPTTNSFRWLYESTNFSLGNLYSPNVKYSHTFNQLILDMNTKSFQYHGQLCYDYARANHDIEGVALKLLDAISSTKMSMVDLTETHFNKFKISLWLVRLKSYIKYIWKKY